MRLPSVIHRLFPTPRRPLRPGAWWALGLYAALVAGALVVVEVAQIVRFARPGAFAWLLAAPWVWWLAVAGWSGLGGWRGSAALGVRLLLLTTAVASLAEPRAVRTSDQLGVVYCLDLSDSIDAATAESARKWMLETVRGKPARDQAGLVVFARNAAVELPPRQAFPFEAVTTSIQRDGTDLEQGLTLAAAILPEDQPGRIVLISDGVGTDGALDRALDRLARAKIPVDVLGIDYEHRDEVWVERITLPKQARPGETYEAAVVMGSLKPGRGTLVLRENGVEIARAPQEWTAGMNRFVLPIRLRGPGWYEYAATVEPLAGMDGWRENNTAVGDLHLAGDGRVLVLRDPDGESADTDSLVKALRGSNRLVELKPAYECPDDALSLMPYDAVVLANVPAEALHAGQQQALRDSVYNLGIGLIMVGGKNSFGPGGWNRTAVEEALPVSMDISQRKVMPKGALAIILHTCEFPDGNTWAKRITKQAIKVLGAKDEVGVIDYDDRGGYQWVFPLTPAGDYEKLVPLIENASPADMPSFEDTMRLAYTGLKGSDAATRHVLIISDGDPSPPPPAVIQLYQQAKITVSTVTVFPHGNVAMPQFDSIAQVTGGRAYFPNDAGKLPAIFIKEAKTLKRSQIQNLKFTPKAGFPSPILKGITAVPGLEGYVLTTPKARAQTILEGPDAEEEDPVLAVWRYGVGASAAFTSDLATNWGRQWVAWDKYQAFVEQLIGAVSRIPSTSHLRLDAEPAGGQGVITVEDHHPQPGFLSVQARVVVPGGGSDLTLPLVQVGPGRYQARFPLSGRGRYQVLIAGEGAGAGGGEPRKERAAGGFVVSYSPEYLRFRADPQALTRIAERTGGRRLTGRETGAELFGVQREPRASSRPVFDWFLLAVALLLPLDVAIRRVQIDWTALVARLRRRRAAPSTAVMGALLSVKAAVRERQPSAGPRPPPLPSTGAVGAVPPKPAPKPAPKPTSTPGVPPAGGGSTAGRLLDAKRRRQEEHSDPKDPKDQP